MNIVNYFVMSMDVWAHVAILLRYESRNTRHIDFPQVDG